MPQKSREVKKEAKTSINQREIMDVIHITRKILSKSQGININKLNKIKWMSNNPE
ncbi:MAG: hypothetical protein AB4038_17000 [Prochloraceae cyanobacterium]